MDQEGAAAPVEAASEAEASEAADLAVEDTAEAASVARAAREDLISVGALARALADGIAVRTITVAAVLAACSDF